MLSGNVSSRWWITLVIVVLFLMPAASASSKVYIEDIYQLRMSLWNGEFDAVDSSLERVKTDIISNGTTDRQLYGLMAAFQIGSSDMEEKLTQWIEATGSSHGYAGRCAYYQYLGWTSRGALLLKNTSQDRIDDMRRFFTLAINDCQRAIEFDPDYSIPYAYLVGMYMALGDRAKLAETMRLGVNQASYSFTLHRYFLFAQIERWGGDLTTMIEHVQSLPVSGELGALRNGFPPYFLAMKEDRAGNYDRAKVFFEFAVMDSGDFDWFRVELANYYFKRGEYEQAIPHYQAYIEGYAYSSDTYYRLAISQEALGYIELAQRNAMIAYEIQPIARHGRLLKRLDSVLSEN